MKYFTYDEVNKLPEEWIKTADGLPPPGQEVIVQTNKGRVTALVRYIRYEGCLPEESWWNNRYGGGNMHVFKAVVAWKPMPKPMETAENDSEWEGGPCEECGCIPEYTGGQYLCQCPY